MKNGLTEPPKGGRIYIEQWHYDSTNTIVGADWQRQISGIKVESGTLKRGDQIVREIVVHPDGHQEIIDESIIAVPESAPCSRPKQLA